MCVALLVTVGVRDPPHSISDDCYSFRILSICSISPWSETVLAVTEVLSGTDGLISTDSNIQVLHP